MIMDYQKLEEMKKTNFCCSVFGYETSLNIHSHTIHPMFFTYIHREICKILRQNASHIFSAFTYINVVSYFVLTLFDFTDVKENVTSRFQKSKRNTLLLYAFCQHQHYFQMIFDSFPD